MATPPVPRTAIEAFLVEGFWPATATDTFREATARLDARLKALERRSGSITVVAATLVPGDESAYWIVNAESTDVVGLACTQAGIQVDRIVGAMSLRADKAVGPGRAPVQTGDRAGVEELHR